MKKSALLIIVIVLVGVALLYYFNNQKAGINGNGEINYKDLVKLETPSEGEIIGSPLTVRGQARGVWFFEATFPITLTNWDGVIMAQGFAQAQGDWMTEGFVPFEAVLQFENPNFEDRGLLILEKNNASGLPENDDALQVTVLFE